MSGGESRHERPALAGASTEYSHYLLIDQLLELQRPLTEGAHDEMLFIVIHQVYELWFKLVLHEGRAAAQALEDGEAQQALAGLRRIGGVMEVLIQQLAVLETMSPDEFMKFRDPLAPASGFQSVQFREMEALFSEGDMTQEGGEPTGVTLYQALCLGMASAGMAMPTGEEGREARLKTLTGLYRDHADPVAACFHQVCEAMVDLDEAMARWRFRHAEMAARQIGDRTGTGGTRGVAYLRATMGSRAFPDLWEVRSRL